jgi:hypothetical protein
VDPLAGKYPSMSPYVYAANNPLKYIDPNGKRWGTPSELLACREAMMKAERQYYSSKGYYDAWRKDKPWEGIQNQGEASAKLEGVEYREPTIKDRLNNIKETFKATFAIGKVSPSWTEIDFKDKDAQNMKIFLKKDPQNMIITNIVDASDREGGEGVIVEYRGKGGVIINITLSREQHQQLLKQREMWKQEGEKKYEEEKKKEEEDQ